MVRHLSCYIAFFFMCLFAKLRLVESKPFEAYITQSLRKAGKFVPKMGGGCGC